MKPKSFAFFSVSFLAFLQVFAACSAPANAPTTQGGPASPTAAPALAGTPTPTGPTATPAPAARTINGRITYQGSTQPLHQVIVVANKQGEQAPAYNAVLKQPGPYTFGNVADGSYTITAFMDLGDDMGPPQANEPVGSYDQNGDGKPDPVVVQDGKGLAGVDITIRDPR